MNKNDFFEYGETSRDKPIKQSVLFSHWIKINNGKWISHLYSLCYCNGTFYTCIEYNTKQISKNKWISEIKLIKCL